MTPVVDARGSDRLAGPLVAAQARGSPACSGQVQAWWRVAVLSAFLAQRFRRLLWCASVRRALQQRGWRWIRPRLAPARQPDQDAQGNRIARHEAQAQARQGL